MNAHRQIVDLKGHDLHLHLPDELADQRLEILIVPSVRPSDVDKKSPLRQNVSIKETAGLLKGKLPDGIAFQKAQRQDW